MAFWVSLSFDYQPTRTSSDPLASWIYVQAVPTASSCCRGVRSIGHSKATEFGDSRPGARGTELSAGGGIIPLVNTSQGRFKCRSTELCAHKEHHPVGEYKPG
ncbi:hypothetical protein B0H14DRAFT_2563595 [Mycena olivaceomarginata]|nr:hypothetical protein B0H14DRAFT_2563595 [Mycena olivaceomarginata]